MIRNTQSRPMNLKLWGMVSLLTVLFSLTIGCGGGTQRLTTNFVVTSLDAQRLGYTPRWATTLNVDPSQTIAYATSLGDVIITLESPSNVVTAIDANDGSIRWRIKWLSDAQRLYEPNRAGDQIVINSDRYIYHLDVRTGRRTSESRLEDQVNDGPVIKDTLAIFGSNVGRVFAHDLVTGHSRWNGELSATILVRPIIVGNNVFTADARGVYALFDATNGQRLWTGRAFSTVSARPVASSTTQLIYIPSEDQNIYAVNRSTGKDRWIYRTSKPFLANPVLLGNTLFVNQQGSLTAIDAITGNKIWSLNENYHAVDLIDQRLIVNGGVYLMVLDATNGKTLREVPFMEPIQSVLTGENDSLIIVAPNGRMVRLDPHG